MKRIYIHSQESDLNQRDPKPPDNPLQSSDFVSTNPLLSSDPLRRGSLHLEAANSIRKLNSTILELERIKAERNSLQAQTHSLSMECGRLERMLEDQTRAESSSKQLLANARDSEGENQRLKMRLGKMEQERSELLDRLKELESKQQLEKMSSSRKILQGSEAVAELERTKEALELKIESLQTDLQDYEVSNRDLALTKTQVSRDVETLELERKELLNKLAERIQHEETVAAETERERVHVTEVHTRHSRLIAAIVISERIEKIALKRKGTTLCELKDARLRQDLRLRSCFALTSIVIRRLQRKLRERLQKWGVAALRSRNEGEKDSLHRAYSMSLSRRTLFSVWQSLTFKVRQTTQTARRRARVQESLDAFLDLKTTKDNKMLQLSVFLGWKSFHLRGKANLLKSELDSASVRGDGLQGSLGMEQERHHKALATKAFSAMFRQVKGQVWSYFAYWQRVATLIKNNKPRIKRVVTIWGKARESMAIKTWQAAVNLQHFSEVLDQSRKLAQNNWALTEHISSLEKILQINIEDKNGQKRKRLRTALILLWRLQIKTGVRTWGLKSVHIREKLQACEAISIFGSRFLTSIGWKQLYRAKLRAISKKLRNNKFIRLVFRESKFVKSLHFRDWVEFCGKRKIMRKVIQKMRVKTEINEKRKGIYSWKDRIFQLRELELHSFVSRLHQTKTDLEGNLLDTSFRLASEQAALSAQQKALKFRSVAKLSKAAQRMQMASLVKGVNTWKDKVNFRSRGENAAGRLQILWKKQQSRKAFRTWTIFIAIALETMYKAELSALKKDLNEQRRSFKVQKDALEEKQIVQETEIQTGNRLLSKSQKEFQGVLQKLVQIKGNSIAKTRYCFESWQTRTRAIKKCTNDIVGMVQKRVMKKGILMIKKYSRSVLTWDRFRYRVMLLVRNIEGCGLRYAVSKWRRNLWKSKYGDLASDLSQSQLSARKIYSSNLQIKDRLSLQMMSISGRYLKLKVIQSWKQIKSQLRLIRLSTQTFESFVASNRVTRAFSSLRTVSTTRKIRKMKIAKELTHILATTKSSVFKAWARRVQSSHAFLTVVSKIWTKLHSAQTRFSFSALINFADLTGQNQSWTSKMQSGYLTRALLLFSKSMQTIGFLQWKRLAGGITNQKRSLKRILRRLGYRRERVCWNYWTQAVGVQKQKVFDENEGPVATLNGHLLEKLEVLQKLLVREGVNLSRFDRFILERESKGTALLNVSVTLPRSFLLWKLYTYKKQRIRNTSKRMLMYRRHSDLYSGFRVWKGLLPQFSPSFRSFSKRELTTVVSKLERDLQHFTSQSEALAGELEYTGNYCQVLESHTRRGQNQALVALHLQLHTPMLKALCRWAMVTKVEQIQKLKESTHLLDQDLQYASSGIEALKIENRALLDENGELRKTTMDGIAFAEALEEAGQENRDIRIELRERAEMIQSLVDENKTLAMRIRRLQSEEEDGYGSTSSSQRLRYKP